MPEKKLTRVQKANAMDAAFDTLMHEYGNAARFECAESVRIVKIGLPGDSKARLYDILKGAK